VRTSGKNSIEELEGNSNADAAKNPEVPPRPVTSHNPSPRSSPRSHVELGADPVETLPLPTDAAEKVVPTPSSVDAEPAKRAEHIPDPPTVQEEEPLDADDVRLDGSFACKLTAIDDVMPAPVASSSVAEESLAGEMLPQAPVTQHNAPKGMPPVPIGSNMSERNARSQNASLAAASVEENKNITTRSKSPTGKDASSSRSKKMGTPPRGGGDVPLTARSKLPGGESARGAASKSGSVTASVAEEQAQATNRSKKQPGLAREESQKFDSRGKKNAAAAAAPQATEAAATDKLAFSEKTSAPRRPLRGSHHRFRACC